MGVGQNTEGELADYVLSRFKKDEIPVMEEAIIKASKASEEIIRKGIDSAMNKYSS